MRRSTDTRVLHADLRARRLPACAAVADQASRLTAFHPSGRRGCRPGRRRVGTDQNARASRPGRPRPWRRTACRTPIPRSAGWSPTPAATSPPDPQGDPARQVRAEGQRQERRHRHRAVRRRGVLRADGAGHALGGARLLHPLERRRPRPAVGVPDRVRLLPAGRRAARLHRPTARCKKVRGPERAIAQAQETKASADQPCEPRPSSPGDRARRRTVTPAQSCGRHRARRRSARGRGLRRPARR